MVCKKPEIDGQKFVIKFCTISNLSLLVDTVTKRQGTQIVQSDLNPDEINEQITEKSSLRTFKIIQAK